MLYVFQALPMSGLTKEQFNENRKRDRDEAVSILINDGKIKSEDDVVFLCNWNDDEPYLDPKLYTHEQLVYLGRGIMNLMSKSNMLVLGHGWEDSKGCQVERLVADLYNIPILYLDRINHRSEYPSYGFDMYWGLKSDQSAIGDDTDTVSG